MRQYFTYILTLALVMVSLAASASPKADARFVAEREFALTWQAAAEQSLKTAFVEVYFKPLEGRGIEIADADAFRALIPDEDVAPYHQVLVEDTTAMLLDVLEPAQLRDLAMILRTNDQLTVTQVFSDEFAQTFNASLAERRAASQETAPNLVALEDLANQMDAFSATLDQGGAETIARDMALAAGPLFRLIGLGRTITQTEVPVTHPVTVAAIETPGVLKFANPVQRQSLLREIKGAQTSTGIRFIKPPTIGSLN